MYSLLLRTNPHPLTLLRYHCLCCLFCWKRSIGFICQNFSLSCIGEGKGKPLWCSCLENPRDRGAWWPAVYGVAQSRTWLKQLSSSSGSSTNTLVGKKSHAEEIIYKILGFCLLLEKKKSLKIFRLHSCKATINSWDKGFCVCAVEPEMKLPTSAGSLKKQECFRKTSTSALLTMPKPLTVWITINWKILKEMGIPDHLTCLLRNLYAGQEATVKTGHGTTDWFQIGKGVDQGCILSPCLFNFYADYIMRNAGLEEAQAGIKIARRNINNLRYADDTTLMAESEEELKNLLMKLKEENEKVGLKLNIQKTKIMVSGPITSWEIDGKTVETMSDFILGLQNHYRWCLQPWN